MPKVKVINEFKRVKAAKEIAKECSKLLNKRVQVNVSLSSTEEGDAYLTFENCNGKEINSIKEKLKLKFDDTIICFYLESSNKFLNYPIIMIRDDKYFNEANLMRIVAE